jgi:hypothetical protein
MHYIEDTMARVNENEQLPLLQMYSLDSNLKPGFAKATSITKNAP